jgi:hypothetical protein
MYKSKVVRGSFKATFKIIIISYHKVLDNFFKTRIRIQEGKNVQQKQRNKLRNLIFFGELDVLSGRLEASSGELEALLELGSPSWKY